jgi:hypothetical protein
MAVNNPTNSLQALGTTDTVTHGTLYVGNTAPSNPFDLSIDKSVAGLVGLSVQNVSASGSAGAVIEVIAPTGGADAYTEYVINGGGQFSVGIDNSASDTFKITTSSDPSSGVAAISIDGSGNVTIPSIIINGPQVIKLTVPGAYPYNVLTTDYAVEVDTSSARTIRLPNAPTTGQVFVIKDITGSAGSNNISLTTVGGVVTIDGATTKTMNVNYASVTVFFSGTAYFII